MSVPVPFLAITNGLFAAVFSRQGGELVPLQVMPPWPTGPA
jgi:hypothetical protein